MLHKLRLVCVMLSPPETEPTSVSQPGPRHQMVGCHLPCQGPSRRKRVSHYQRLLCSSAASVSVPRAGFTWALLDEAMLTWQGPPSPHQHSHPLLSGCFAHLSP